MSSCSGFAAMFLANLKNVKGLRTSGVAGICCARHGLWRKNGMGDLQVGERCISILHCAMHAETNVRLMQVL